MNKNGIIYPNVKLGKNYRLDTGVILGFSEDVENKDVTNIGKNAIFRVYTVVCAGVKIGDNFQTGPNVFIREDNIIGNEVVVWHSATISLGNVIGDGCRIHAGSFLELVTLGKRVFIGPNVVFADDPHPVNPSPRTCFGGAVVEDEAVIGANVTVLPHVRIGRKAVVGAGSTVTKNIPAGEVWVGNPAKFLKRVEDVVCNVEGKKHYPYKEYWNIK
ncbi:N-acetyltransferase [Patescibacteria group bacterium]|nr:N-acetyltransferase [Patescibacteria group bacterium]